MVIQNAYFGYYVVLSQTYTYYKRTAFTIFDIFRVIEGLFELFTILGGNIVSFISNKMLKGSLISISYQVNRRVYYQDKVVLPTQTWTTTIVSLPGWLTHRFNNNRQDIQFQWKNHPRVFRTQLKTIWKNLDGWGGLLNLKSDISQDGYTISWFYI